MDVVGNCFYSHVLVKSHAVGHNLLSMEALVQGEEDIV